ncbi:MAG TPA: EAL domain-containing protein [Miltoncostaeales bacterium]|nr:EAL domain-containing protein [Miltoncostaeales bacterium]
MTDGAEQRRTGSAKVSTRMLAMMVVPVTLLAISAGRQALNERDTAGQAVLLQEHVNNLVRENRLRGALFAEQLAVDLLRRGVDAKTGTLPASVTARQQETDVALAALTGERPFEVSDLERARRVVTDPDLPTPQAVFRYVKLDQTISDHISETVSKILSLSIESGDTRTAKATRVVVGTMAAYEANNRVVIEYNRYTDALPIEATLQRSYLAKAAESFAAAATALADIIEEPLAGEWSVAARMGGTFDLEVKDALEGALPPRNANVSAETLAVLSDGAARSTAIALVVPRASAATQQSAADLVRTTGADARRAWLLAVLSLFVSAATALWFARSIVVPSRRLTAMARSISSGAMDVPPLMTSGPPELADAAGALNEAVANLAVLDRKAQALANAQFDSPVLNEPLPGRIGEALDRSLTLLSNASAEREGLRQRLAFEARHDSLTGLPNRAAVIAELERQLDSHGSARAQAFVAFLDLDNFKHVNDTYGHGVGDEVLQLTAQRVSELMGSLGEFGRLGGDEFLMVFHAGDRSTKDVCAIMKDVVACLTAPMLLPRATVELSACVGIAVAESSSAGDVLRRADLALATAKQTGAGTVQFYDAVIHAQVQELTDMEHGLRHAMSVNDQLSLVYQPIVDASTGALVSAEALLRWNRPDHGMVPPTRFIVAAEQSQLINELDRWVVRRALRQISDWNDHPELASVSVAINISGRHLLDPHFVDEIGGILAGSGVDPSKVIIEITETVLVTDLDNVAARLDGLRALGLRVAMDDFGTGYTGLAQFRAMTIDELKLDKSIIDGLMLSVQDVDLVRLVCSMATHMGVSTVAEGVETAEQFDRLRDLGCGNVQGYHVAHPMPPDAFADWAADRALVIETPSTEPSHAG